MKFYIAELLLILIIFFDGLITFLNIGLNYTMEGNLIVAWFIQNGLLFWIISSLIYISILVWLYHKNNSLRIAVFGAFFLMHLYGFSTWIFGHTLMDLFSTSSPTLLVIYLAMIGFVSGAIIYLYSSETVKFLDKKIKIGVI